MAFLLILQVHKQTLVLYLKTPKQKQEEFLKHLNITLTDNN